MMRAFVEEGGPSPVFHSGARGLLRALFDLGYTYRWYRGVCYVEQGKCAFRLSDTVLRRVSPDERDAPALEALRRGDPVVAAGRGAGDVIFSLFASGADIHEEHGVSRVIALLTDGAENFVYHVSDSFFTRLQASHTPGKLVPGRVKPGSAVHVHPDLSRYIRKYLCGRGNEHRYAEYAKMTAMAKLLYCARDVAVVCRRAQDLLHRDPRFSHVRVTPEGRATMRVDAGETQRVWPLAGETLFCHLNVS